jgi:hypothetical protein
MTEILFGCDMHNPQIAQLKKIENQKSLKYRKICFLSNVNKKNRVNVFGFELMVPKQTLQVAFVVVSSRRKQLPELALLSI